MDVSEAQAASAIWYRSYESELDLPSVMALVGSELSEPYVIYTYRYFLVNWWVVQSASGSPVF
jgi:peptide alpha-N-acetyltransferase